MEVVRYRQFFWLPNSLYMAVGYDFQGAPRPQWRQYLFNCFLFFSATSGLVSRFYTFKQQYVLIRARDTMGSIRLCTFVSYSIDSSIKFLTFFTNRQRLRKIYDTLAQEYPQTPDGCRSHNVHLYYLSRLTRVVIFLYVCFAYWILAVPLFESFLLYVVDMVRVGIRNAAFPYLHPTPMPYNFDYRTPVRYMLVYTSEFMNGHFCSLTNMATDLFMVLFMSQICMHLEYIGRSLEEYEPGAEHDDKDCEFLADLVRKHQLMFALRDELDDIFGISLLFNLLSVTAVLCVVAVQLTVEGFGYEFLKFLGFFFSLVSQLFIVCRYGQILINSSMNVAESGYKNHWYNGTMRYKKLLLIIIVRAQKQADITAKNFHSISLETFQMLMGMTYRLFTLLNTMLN